MESLNASRPWSTSDACISHFWALEVSLEHAQMNSDVILPCTLVPLYQEVSQGISTPVVITVTMGPYFAYIYFCLPEEILGGQVGQMSRH